ESLSLKRKSKVELLTSRSDRHMVASTDERAAFGSTAAGEDAARVAAPRDARFRAGCGTCGDVFGFGSHGPQRSVDTGPPGACRAHPRRRACPAGRPGGRLRPAASAGG